MSKQITIPSGFGNPVNVLLNGIKYTYTAGAVETVPDEVAALFESNALNAVKTGRRAVAQLEAPERKGPRKGVALLVDDNGNLYSIDDAATLVRHAAGAIVSVADGADGMPIKHLTVNIEPVQSGTGDPSPENIRPISGWTGLTGARTGKNLIDWKVSSTAKSVYLKPSTYVLSWNGTFSQSGLWYMRAKDSSGNYYDSKSALGLDSSWTHSNSSHWNYSNINNPIVFRVPSGCSEVEFFKQNADGTIPAQLEFGSTATEYEDGQVSTISVTWATEAGTVYGATLDLLTGELTVTWAAVDMGTFNWDRRTNSTHPYFAIAPNEKMSNSPPLCSIYRTVNSFPSLASFGDTAENYTIAGSTSNAYVAIRDDRFADSASFKAAVSGAQLCYKLRAPIVYQLNPVEISTLLGNNTIYVDCGSVTVDYCADASLSLDELNANIGKQEAAIMASIAPIENGATASQAYAQGALFYLNGTLCKAKVDIASGAAFTLNTNYQSTTLAAELAALQ